jgi:hypothetical protein
MILIYTQKFKSIEELKKEIDKYIIYYNNVRIKSNLNKMSPKNIELIIFKINYKFV